jgi:hypothetical protein
MVRRAVLVPMALLLTTLYAAGHAQERRVVCVLVDDLGFGASDRENSAKLLAVLRDEVVRESDLVGFASTGPSAITADLRPAGTRNLEHAMERLAAVASPGQSVRPVQSWDATRIALGTASDIVGNLARLQNRDKQFLLLTSRTSADVSFAATFAQAGETAPPDLTNEVAAVVAAAKAGNVTLRVVSTDDPQGAVLLRAMR